MAHWDWPTIAGVLGVAIAVMALVGKAWQTIRRVMHRTEQFLDDWQGEPARPGYEARPGVIQQLASVKAEQDRVSYELQHNGGGSLKDGVRRTEQALREIQSAQARTHQAQQRDHDAIQNLSALLGSFIGREQAVRYEGHKEAAQLWQAVEAINGNTPTTEEDDQ